MLKSILLGLILTFNSLSYNKTYLIDNNIDNKSNKTILEQKVKSYSHTGVNPRIRIGEELKVKNSTPLTLLAYNPPYNEQDNQNPLPKSPVEVYWAAQTDAVKSLRLYPIGPDRAAKALALAEMGELVDVPIMVWGWDPEVVMGLRKDYGYTWVPSALMSPIVLAPGLKFPGLPEYDPKNIPIGAIVVKFPINEENYPPKVKVEPPKPLPTQASPVCGNSFGNLYFVCPQANKLLNHGDVVTEDRGKFVFYRVPGPGGISFSEFFKKVD